MANGDVLETLKKKIEIALQSKNLPKADRTLLEIQQLFVIYLQSDHLKVEEIYPFVMEQKKESVADKLQRREAGRYYLRLTIGTAITSVVILAINGIVWFFNVLPALQKLAELQK